MAHPDALSNPTSIPEGDLAQVARVAGEMPRRALIGLLALPVLELCAGCGRKKHDLPKPLPDVAVLTGAIAAEQSLISLYDATLAAHPALTGRLAPLLAHHHDHLSVLRRHYVPATNEKTATPRAAVSATPNPPPSVPADQSRALTAVRAAERDAAAARLTDLTKIPAGLAQLFASISACEAGHAALLGGG